MNPDGGLELGGGALAFLTPWTPRPRRTAIGALRLAALALLLIGPATAAPAQEPPESAVKADYLYKFAAFVTWPAAPAAATAFTICVVGNDPFGPVLDHTVAGQRIGDRPIVIRRLSAVDHASPCQIAFLGGSGAQSVKEALHLLHGAPVLTVTEGPAAPGVVDFGVEQGHVRFRIDDQAAAENGLAISSKLLDLATSTNPRRPPDAKP